MIKKLIIILFFYSIHVNVSSQNVYAVGVNTNVWYNKFSSGIQLSILKKAKQKNTKPLWSLQLNYGLLGSKEYIQNKVELVGGAGLFIDNIIDIPIGSFPDISGYYTKEQKTIITGFNAQITKDFSLIKHLFFGVGIGYANAIDKGYAIYVNPRTKDTLTENLSVKYSSYSILSKLGYYYDFNDKLLLNVVFYFQFYFPLTSEVENYKATPSLPILGVEQELSLSISYKF